MHFVKQVAGVRVQVMKHVTVLLIDSKDGGKQ
jgi:hypothetical protein